MTDREGRDTERTKRGKNKEKIERKESERGYNRSN